MPYKDVSKQRAAWRRYYHRHPKRVLGSRLRRRNANRAKLVALKLRCSRCPESDPICLDFHHKDRRRKEMTISMAVRNDWAWDRLLREVRKCEVLCANCHRREHRDDIMVTEGEKRSYPAVNRA